MSLFISYLKTHHVKDLVALAAIWLLCGFLGLIYNALSPEPLSFIYQNPQQRLDKTLAYLATRSEGSNELVEISLEEMRDAVDQKKLILDARPHLLFRLGHIPRAINLSREQFSQDFISLKSFLEPSRKKEIFVYCSGIDCDDSRLVARALKRLEFTHVYVFPEGWEGWKAGNFPEEKSK